MSPRSEEFMQQARDRVADAQAIIGTAHPAVVVSAAYYGMLYAARAALSERGEFAKTLPVAERPAAFAFDDHLLPVVKRDLQEWPWRSARILIWSSRRKWRSFSAC
jgi:hypothetical protein